MYKKNVNQREQPLTHISDLVYVSIYDTVIFKNG